MDTVWPSQSVKNDFVIRYLVKNRQPWGMMDLQDGHQMSSPKKLFARQFYRLSPFSTKQKELIS
jgi:hypothetical protein